MKRKCCSQPNHEHCLNCDSRMKGNAVLKGANGFCSKCWKTVGPGVELKGRKRCIVDHCQNYSDQGIFNGNLCSPCAVFIVAGNGRYSQAYRNALAIISAEIGETVKVGIRRLLDPTGTMTLKGPDAKIYDDELRRSVLG